MPFPLLPLGYAAVASALAIYGGKKIYDKSAKVAAVAQEVKFTTEAVVKDVKDATEVTKVVVQDATDRAKEQSLQTINTVVDSVAHFSSSIQERAHALKAALLAAGFAILGAWAAVSAFFVGMMAGFGIHFLRLIDKTSLFHELVFYATIISALRAPAALVAALAVDETRAKAVEWTTPVLLITAVLVSCMFLDYFYAIIFWLIVSVLLFLTWLRPQALDRSFYVVCALAFGYLYAESLLLQKPDTSVTLADQKSAQVTLLMSTPRGLIGLNAEKQMTQYAWSSVVRVSVEPGSAKLNEFRELLRNSRATFESNFLPAGTAGLLR
jgi:hypothetical protein